MILVLTEEQVDVLRRGALEKFPVDACALLFGRFGKAKSEVIKVVLAESKLRSPVRFEV